MTTPQKDSIAVLNQHCQQLGTLHLKQLFEEDSLRFQKFSLETAGLMLDYSKNHILEQTLTYLIYHAKTVRLSTQIEALFSGECVNETEERPALHTALRNQDNQRIYINGMNITKAVAQTLTKMEHWVTRLQTKQWLGYSQKPITDVVHIGIGGSHLGPLMATQALQPHPQAPACHFVASVDATEITHLLTRLNPETTLFIIASKTFSTQETLLTADRAKNWLLKSARDADISSQFVATTANTEKAMEYGIAPKHVLPFWDWVGGRYSIWSAIGLPVAIQTGMDTFRALLAGAYAMDQHFRSAPLNVNMPVILALLGFWNIRFLKANVHAVLPYDYRLRSFPRYLQQLDMESNGKSTQINGNPADGTTAPIIFGEIGTNGQHSFHQLLFQGTHFIPCDFIATLDSEQPGEKDVLLSHCLAQSRGLMLGKSIFEIENNLLERGYSAKQADLLAKHKNISGNQPSNTILISKLTPQTLGALMALYEHKIFVQGVLWNINSFDQWGVELGKEIAKDLLTNLENRSIPKQYDSSTRGLLDYIYRSWKNK